jgi:hypothetical protein
MDLMQQWCAKVDVTEPVNGSWLFALCDKFKVSTQNNALYNLAIYYKVNKRELTNGTPLLQAIAQKLGAREPKNGSWLKAIVDKL